MGCHHCTKFLTYTLICCFQGYLNPTCYFEHLCKWHLPFTHLTFLLIQKEKLKWQPRKQTSYASDHWLLPSTLSLDSCRSNSTFILDKQSELFTQIILGKKNLFIFWGGLVLISISMPFYPFCFHCNFGDLSNNRIWMNIAENPK